MWLTWERQHTILKMTNLHDRNPADRKFQKDELANPEEYRERPRNNKKSRRVKREWKRILGRKDKRRNAG